MEQHVHDQEVEESSEQGKGRHHPEEEVRQGQHWGVDHTPSLERGRPSLGEIDQVADDGVSDGVPQTTYEHNEGHVDRRQTGHFEQKHGPEEEADRCGSQLVWWPTARKCQFVEQGQTPRLVPGSHNFQLVALIRHSFNEEGLISEKVKECVN